jgi:hypothetical protein
MPETAKSAREISHSFFSETNDSSDAKDYLIDQLRLELKDLKLKMEQTENSTEVESLK